jgi:predicted DNA-binding protein (MmcQ/YjbR family)
VATDLIFQNGRFVTGPSVACDTVILMSWEELVAYCMAKPGAWQDEPWDGDVVAKVGGKIFAFLGSGANASVGLKCGANRDAADEWLARYPGDASVMAYIGRSGWNTLRVGGAIPDDELIEAIDASYAAVVSKLPKKDRPA